MNYITKHCLFCNDKEQVEELYPKTFSKQDLTPEIFSARRTFDRLHYQIVRCKNCNLVFSREILPDEALGNLYSRSKVTFNEQTNIIRKDYWNGLIPFMDRIKKGSALEIGCSNGFFMEELFERGFKEVYGCEPSTEAIKMANPHIKKSITAALFQENLYRPNQFDFICSFQTLDHLPDPVKTVKACRNLLKPNGIAYFITHNVDSLSARILKEKSPIIDIEHIYLFNKNTLRKLFKENGFNIIGLHNLKNSYPINYYLKMLSWNKLNTLTNTFKLGDIRFPLAAGNIAVVAEAKK